MRLNTIRKLFAPSVKARQPRRTVHPVTPARKRRLHLEDLEDRTVPSGGLVGNLVIFGDSLSDTGNAALATGGAVPNPALYYQGRFSNGPLWVDTLAKYLGEPSIQPSLAGGLDYAYGGATVAYQNQPPPFNAFPRVAQQVGQYLAGHTPAANDLMVVWAGANDFNESFSSPTGPISPILSADTLAGSLATLANAGARQFVVPNLPPLGETPFIRGLGVPGLSAAGDQWTAAFDTELGADVASFKAHHPGTNVVALDVASLFQQVTQPRNPFGFVNTADAVGPLVPGSPFLAAITATDPQDYLFYDGVHPTSKGHQLVGLEAAAAVYDALGVHHLVVTNTADTVDPMASGLSLREMLNLSNAMTGQQTISFDLGPGPHQITLSGKELVISQDVSINGPGMDQLTISGAGASRVFDISGGAAVAMSGLTIAKGLVQGDVQGGGGGILNESGATLNLSAMAFTDNIAIPNFVSNQAWNAPGGGGGAVLNQSGASLTINDSTFAGNQAVGGMGGGIWNQVGSTGSVSGCVFTNNQAVGTVSIFIPGAGVLTGGEGGGIDNDGTLTVSHSTFVNNQVRGGSGSDLSEGSGGGIGNDGRLTVAASAFTGNQAFGGTSPSYQFAIGGGISNWNFLTVTGTTFTDNLANGGTNSFGGGIGNGVGGTGQGGTIIVNGSSFTGNQAIGGAAVVGGQGIGSLGGHGGGIDSEGPATVIGSTFSGNQAIGTGPGGDATGGAIDNGPGGPLTVSNSTFTGNQASGFFTFGGGAIVNFATGSRITNSTFLNNQGIGSGPGGYGAGGSIDNEGMSLTVASCILSGNKALGGPGGDGVNTPGFVVGGGISSVGALTVLNSTLMNNVAIGGALAKGAPASSNTVSAGGGINESSGTLTLTNSSLVGNQVIGVAGGSGGAGSVALGGGVSANSGATATVTNCTISANAAIGGAGGKGAPGGAGAGGGIDVSIHSTAAITGCTVTGNQDVGGAGGARGNGGDGVGGGISAGSGVLFGMADTTSVTISGSTLSGNVAQGGAGGSGGNGGNGLGGGIYVAAGTTVGATHTLIVNNRADGGAGGDGGSDGLGEGGGVYRLGTFTYDVTTVIGDNQASTKGDNLFP